MSFRLKVRNYRGLRAVDWSPEGVCVLVGTNGSGKTTLLEVFALLGDALDRGLARALEDHGGIANARNMFAADGEPYDFEVSFGDVTWRLAPILAKNGFRPDETLTINGRVVISRKAGADHAQIFGARERVTDELALTAAVKRPRAEGSVDVLHALKLPELLTRYRLHRSYDLVALRRSGSPDSGARRLDRRGVNVFSVLRNWRDKRQDHERYEFVLDGLREIFTDVFFQDIEFEKAAQVVGASLRLKGDRVHSASLAPDGWFAALLHLTAVASTDHGDLIAIDEPENGLHPHAIKLLLERMRAWSGRHSITVLLSTHSPVIIHDFGKRPEQLFVMQRDQPVCPVAAVDLVERDWLARFALGYLYMREEFGAPRDDAEHRPHHDG